MTRIDCDRRWVEEMLEAVRAYGEQGLGDHFYTVERILVKALENDDPEPTLRDVLQAIYDLPEPQCFAGGGYD